MPECPNCGHKFTEPPEWTQAAREKANWDELVRLGQELGAHDTMVCVVHKRFIPCRKGYDPLKNGSCLLSENPEDIAYVHRYQRGEVD